MKTKKPRWTPGSRIGCNHGTNNPGHQKGKPLPKPSRFRRKAKPGSHDPYLEASLDRIVSK